MYSGFIIAEKTAKVKEIGYRHIDTAQAYGNERGVGEGVRICGIPREELFVVSKVAAEHKTYQMCRKTPSFSYGGIRHVHRIYASN